MAGKEPKGSTAARDKGKHKNHQAQGSLFDPKMDLNPKVLLLEDIHHPWVEVYLGIVRKWSPDQA